jgi:hypothetical protein
MLTHCSQRKFLHLKTRAEFHSPPPFRLNTRKQIRHISTSRSKRGNATPGVIPRMFGKRKGVPVFPSFGRSVTEPGVTTGNISAGVLRVSRCICSLLSSMTHCRLGVQTMEFKRETFQSPISSTASPETVTTTTETTSTSTGGLKVCFAIR